VKSTGKLKILIDLSKSMVINLRNRISLEEGQFLKSFESVSSEVNTLHFNRQLNVLTSGGQQGVLEMWDYRSRTKASSKIVNNGQNLTTINFDSSGLIMGVGSDKGLVRLYDVRYDTPCKNINNNKCFHWINKLVLFQVIEIKHHYKLPINTIKFHEKTRNILSSSERIIKINNKDSGKVFTSVEPSSGINRFTIVPETGLILVAAEEPRIGTYFIPQLDNAPNWCSFL